MKNKAYIIVILILLTVLFAARATAADSKKDYEQNIKAAFLFNFVNFVDWPKERMPDNDEPIIIGIIGNKDSIKAFAPIKGKKIRGKNIIIKQFDDLSKLEKSKDKNNSSWDQKIESLKKCHIVILYRCDNDARGRQTAIIKELKGTPTLLVGESPGMLERGCNINFLVEKNKVRFEINLVSTKHNNLKIRSKLLKLAKRIIKE